MEFHDNFFLVCVTAKSCSGAACRVGFQQLAASRSQAIERQLLALIDFFLHRPASQSQNLAFLNWTVCWGRSVIG
ncbi:hypothetical protein [Microcoleus sp. herbarium12]|uniref:hypothetical protein n=1 Tax=Microcoleus sp. herbarium12 TaxID=3055437 RepID=UPI002FCF659D